MGKITGGLAETMFDDKVAQYIAVTMIGGAVSEAAGGDFLDGAISAAMVHLFNDTQAKAEADAENYRAGGIYVIAFQTDPNDPNSWHVQNPLGAGYERAYGANAGQYYGGYAKRMFDVVYNGLAMGFAFGTPIYWGVKGLGYASSTAWTGALVSGANGFIIGGTSSATLGSKSPKDFIDNRKNEYINEIIKNKSPSLFK